MISLRQDVPSHNILLTSAERRKKLLFSCEKEIGLHHRQHQRTITKSTLALCKLFYHRGVDTLERISFLISYKMNNEITLVILVYLISFE